MKMLGMLAAIFPLSFFWVECIFQGDKKELGSADCAGEHLVQAKLQDWKRLHGFSHYNNSSKFQYFLQNWSCSNGIFSPISKVFPMVDMFS